MIARRRGCPIALNTSRTAVGLVMKREYIGNYLYVHLPRNRLSLVSGKSVDLTVTLRHAGEVLSPSRRCSVEGCSHLLNLAAAFRCRESHILATGSGMPSTHSSLNSSQPTAAITVDQVSWTPDDLHYVLSDVSVTFGSGLTGVVGDNGSGKTTLISLITGDLPPSSGRIITGDLLIGYLPQHLTWQRADTLADVLGVRSITDAIAAIEAGDVQQENFDVIGDDWDIETRAIAALSSAGIDVAGLDRTVQTLSGGEIMIAKVIGLTLTRHDVLILDEPTNNLDVDTRLRLYELLGNWRGICLVVSHDIELLERVDAIVELHGGRAYSYGGNWTAYREQLEAEQSAATQKLIDAKQQLKRQRAAQQHTQTRIAHSASRGKAKARAGGIPKIILNQMASDAGATHGRLRQQAAERIEAAANKVDDAGRAIRKDDVISLDLSHTTVPRVRKLLELRLSDDRVMTIGGQDRVGVIGPNGAGKSTLIGAIAKDGPVRHLDVDVRFVSNQLSYLDQALEIPDEAASAVDLLRAGNKDITPHKALELLAPLQLRGETAQRPLSTLSGGESFRAILGAALHADPPPQLLVLDEPSNNLDVSTVRQLTAALVAYRGGLIIASHDRPLLAGLQLTHLLTVNPDGTVTPGPGEIG